ncbi:hypothetical protein [Piscinibacter gummiphilus]|uniref:Uncharacterized protein n=1 Tax=Piscinibacter gummiphilus TaxID=946333 RepID=A0ABZ0D2A0_9BURK|nr:hypothetical protein [Piscinibacter gummiphilus]WOB11297.1 hypothetical protein RXV79_27075 [Piscinibacter gummiphilus]
MPNVPRSNRPEVRNPIAADPEVALIVSELPALAREALRKVLLVLSRKWDLQAEHSWSTRKPPLASYFRVNAVNSRHLARALKKLPFASREAEFLASAKALASDPVALCGWLLANPQHLQSVRMACVLAEMRGATAERSDGILATAEN